ncbi:hypothetical protein D621_14780 [beta proteobacterium AAP51]|nr:hypothetical protein D621_14780 [beta proteobacterium AAP51]
MNRPRLNETMRHHFTEAVEASISVTSRQQFFVWTQSAVQGLVPHEILICGVREFGSAGLRLHHFSASRYFKQPQFDAVADPQHGLLPRLMAMPGWADGVLLCPSAEEPRAPCRLEVLVSGNELRNLAVRMVPATDGSVAAVYGFSRLGQPLDATLRHAVEVLVPHLHHAFVRVLQNEREQQQASAPRDERVVTRRQQEILLLIKDGKTNSEIATLLSCSQWTVKNHIQNILRRLGTSSRAHAISRAMSLGILRPD